MTDERPNLLFLVHRLPYPPNKGDKIRSFHLLRHLASRYKVHLGCFVDDKNDMQYVSDVSTYCESVFVRTLNPKLATVRSAVGLITAKPLSLPYYYDSSMQEWVNASLSNIDVDVIVAYSSPMGQYVSGPAYANYLRVMDFVDVDSDKWRQYAEGKYGPMRWVYRREWRQLAKVEREIAAEFSAVTFVTENEVALFDSISPETSAKHVSISNGVDTEFFSPAATPSSPFAEGTKAIVFVGMMDYWANVDAVTWFCKKVFVDLRKKNPKVEFFIVGGSPTAEVSRLADIDGVTVTGRVDDVRGYLAYGLFCVATLRIARGVQNKVLEALAMGSAVVCSSQALSGLAAGAPVVTADSPVDVLAACQQLLDPSARETLQQQARSYVLENYDWAANLEKFSSLLEPQAFARIDAQSTMAES